MMRMYAMYILEFFKKSQANELLWHQKESKFIKSNRKSRLIIRHQLKKTSKSAGHTGHTLAERDAMSTEIWL